MKIIMKGQTIEGTPEEIISMLKLIDAPAKPIARKCARQKDVETMREMRNQGKTYKQIARATGWAKTTVYKCLNG